MPFRSEKLMRLFMSIGVAGVKDFKELLKRVDYGEGAAKVCERARDPEGRTVFSYAAFLGNTDLCKYLIEELNLDVNMKDDLGDTPLFLATLNERLPTAEYLIKIGANVKESNDMGTTALHNASKTGDTYLMQLLISNGADVEANSTRGTPLQIAASNGKEGAIRILLEHNANPNLASEPFCTPLFLAVRSNSLECMELLIQAGADPNIGSCGLTCLSSAASFGNVEILKCLLRAGADPNVVNADFMTPLERGAVSCKREVVEALLPVTSRFPCIPGRSVDEIMNYVRSEEMNIQMDINRKKFLEFSKTKAVEAIQRNEYFNAMLWYTEAINAADKADAKLLSNRSFCFARLKFGDEALADAIACVAMMPHWQKAHYREGVAWKLLNKHDMAAAAFSQAQDLDPKDSGIRQAYAEAKEAAKSFRFSFKC